VLDAGMRGMGRLGATPDDNRFSRLRDQSKRLLHCASRRVHRK
jgi:hypothetical protein